MEIKAARTWSSDFPKGLDKFRKLSTKACEGTVIYSGDAVQTIGDNRLIHFINTAEAIER